MAKHNHSTADYEGKPRRARSGMKKITAATKEYDSLKPKKPLKTFGMLDEDLEHIDLRRVRTMGDVLSADESIDYEQEELDVINWFLGKD